MEDAAAQQPKQEEVSTSNPPSEVRKGPMQPPEEPTEVETSAAPVPGAAVSTKTTQEMVSPEPPAAAKEAASGTEVATSEQPQKNEAGQEDTGPSASRGSAPVTPPKASEPRKPLYKGYTEEEWEEWRQAQNQPVRRTYKQKWKSNEELEAQRRRPGKREREALRQQGPAVPSPRETPKWPPPQPPSPRRAVKREQITQSENPPGEVSANVARSSQSENPPGEVADSGARSSQSENPQGEVPGQAKEEKPQAEEEPQPAQAKAPKVQGAKSSASDEYSYEEEEAEVLEVRGKANSPAKTWVGELPTALAIGKPEEEQRLVLLKKGSYRAVYCHPTDKNLLWKVGDHGDEEKWLKLYGDFTMPKLHKRIPLKLVLEKGRFTPPGENLVALEVERCKALPALLPEHLLCMITILVFMRAQGIVLKDTGYSNWGLRYSLSGFPELILLDGGSWQPAEPAPIKSLKEVSGFRDVLTDHASVRTAITRIFQESKPEPQVQMAYLTRALRERSDLGEALWRSLHRQRVLVCAPTKEYYVMIPRGSALHQPDSWRLEMLKEEAKERGSTE